MITVSEGAAQTALTVTFTPTDTDYEPVTATVTVEYTSDATVTGTLTYGAADNNTYSPVLDAIAEGAKAGAYEITSPEEHASIEINESTGVITVSGGAAQTALTVTFTPTDTDYEPVTATVTVEYNEGE